MAINHRRVLDADASLPLRCHHCIPLFAPFLHVCIVASHTTAAAAAALQVRHTEEEWRKLLTPGQYHILREEGTERPFSRCVRGAACLQLCSKP